ncbi:MAG: protein kinase [Planctomycetaceae bacterium]
MPCHPDSIADYLDDRLSPQDEMVFECHLDQCETCRRAIAESAGSGNDWSAVASALRSDEYDEEGIVPNSVPAWPLALLGPTDDPRMLGRIGPFEVSGCVGVGGMGVVFKARDPALDRYVAVKVLSPQLAASENARIRFAREAKAAAAVVHDNVIAVYQVSEYQGLPYLVMPYLPGPSLEERLKRFGPLPPLEALRVAQQVAAGLQAAHAQGLIHRDIKPANILLSGTTERAVLTDFGLARAADDATLTRSGTLAGTPQFMAPEQARGEPTDARSDLFSLGALLFSMLTARPPVADLSGSETVRRVGHQRPPKLSSVMQDVPAWLEQLVESLHAFDPNRRLPSAAVAGREIRNAMPKASGMPLKHLDESSQSLAVRRRKHSLMIAGSAVLLCGAGLWFLWPERSSVISVSSPFSDQRREAEPVSHDTPVIVLPTDQRTQPKSITPPTQQQVEPVFPAASPPTDADGLRLDQLLQSIETGLDQLENR